MTRKTRSIRLAAQAVTAERRNGCVYLRSPHALPGYPRSMTERFDEWAARRRRRRLAPPDVRRGAPPGAAHRGGAARAQALGRAAARRALG
jgi:hypothetical protein